MRRHELLYLLADLTDWLGRDPTREELSESFLLNKELFNEGHSGMGRCLRYLKETQCVEERGCCETCHARHVHITPKGRALLEEWNAHGCESENRDDTTCRPGRFEFKAYGANPAP